MDAPEPVDNNPPVDDNNPPADDNNPGPAAAEGPNRLKVLREGAKDAAAAVAGEGLGIVGSVAKGAKGVVDLATGVTSALGARAQTSAQKHQTKLATAEATSKSKIAAAVSESEKQAYKRAIEAEKKAKELSEQTLKNEMDNFKAGIEQSKKQQTIKNRQQNKAHSEVNASQVDITSRDGVTITTSFKKLESQQVGDTEMFFAVPKTMDDLNRELLENFGRNFANGDFELGREDKNALFRSLEHNVPVPPVKYLKGWIKWFRGTNPVLREKQAAITGGGKKRTSKRKKRTSKRQRTRTGRTKRRRTKRRKNKKTKRKYKRVSKKRMRGGSSSTLPQQPARSPPAGEVAPNWVLGAAAAMNTVRRQRRPAAPEPVIQNEYERQWSEWRSATEDRYPSIQFTPLSLSIGEEDPYPFTFADLESGNTFKVVGGNFSGQLHPFITENITFDSIQVSHSEYLFTIIILDGRGWTVMVIMFCADQSVRGLDYKPGWNLQYPPTGRSYIKSFTPIQIS